MTIELFWVTWSVRSNPYKMPIEISKARRKLWDNLEDHVSRWVKVKTFLIQETEGKKPETGWWADKAPQLLEARGSRGPFPEGKTAACMKDLAMRLWQRDEDNRENQ